jgi:hypothetical protein
MPLAREERKLSVILHLCSWPQEGGTGTRAVRQTWALANFLVVWSCASYRWEKWELAGQGSSLGSEKYWECSLQAIWLWASHFSVTLGFLYSYTVEQIRWMHCHSSAQD